MVLLVVVYRILPASLVESAIIVTQLWEDVNIMGPTAVYRPP